MVAPKVQILPLRKSSPPSSTSSESSSEQPTDDSNKENIPAHKKTRASKPKVRSGCVTCKIRHVKCDETKPECNKCTSTGRKCDGYLIVPRKKGAGSAPASSLALTSDITPAELRSLDYFYHKTAPSLSGYFDAEFWTRLVFQMSYIEPSIRHAMVAVGALHEKRDNSTRLVPILQSVSDPVLRSQHNDAFALSQYNKAITHLSHRMNSESSIDVALLACILFVCLEFLRGDVEPAINHFKGGMSIAMSTLSNTKSRMAAESMQRIKEYMLPFFNRIELLSTLFGNESPWDYPVDLLEAVPDEFENIKEARDSIVHLANLSIRFIRSMKFSRYSRIALPDDYSRQSALLRQLHAWGETLDKMLLAGAMSEKELCAAKTLRIHQLVASMWLGRSIVPEEMFCDESNADSETAVSLAEAIQEVAGSREQRMAMVSSTFLFDMEIVSPLYYVATKCRDPGIRRRAITVLKASHRREGLWDSQMAGAIAERIVEIEEVNLTTLNGSELPAEKNRVHHTDINSEIGTNPKKHNVTFHTKPNGVDEEWHIWEEKIILP